MATCPSCAAMVEADAASCWHCGAAILRPAAGEFDGPATDTDGGAPTLLAADDDGSRTRAGDTMLGREIIGQYVIVDKLGEGGMGEVFLADQPAIGRQVAIKVVHAHTRDRDHDDHVERFRNEAKAAASLESAHIVSIFNWGELEDGTLFMAMEYLPGRTLAELLREQGSLEPVLAVSIAGQICAALAEAHGAGVVHRDLKPSNIMLLERKGEGEGGEPSLFAKVLDFGVAKLEGSDITRSGAMFGTPQYMSPEQLRGDAIDGRSDLYSLGVMLYEMLTGALPFSSPTAVGFITAHLHETPPPLPRSVPRALAEVVMQMLAKRSSERPANAEAAAEELWAALGGRDTRAGRQARQRGRRRLLRRSLAATLVLGLLGTGAYGAWWMWDQQQQIQAKLEREKAEAIRLRRELETQTALAEEARAEAQREALANQDAAEEAQAMRRQIDAGRARPINVDPDTRRLLGLSLGQLEATLRSELEGRRIPPSEVAGVLEGLDESLEQYREGELGEGELRDQLVALIGLYRQRFLPLRRGDRMALEELERVYLEMDGKTPHDSRRDQLDHSYADYDRNVTLTPDDQAYYKRMVVAELIRNLAADEDELERLLVLGKRLRRDHLVEDDVDGDDEILPPPEDDLVPPLATTGGHAEPPPPLPPPPLPGLDD